MATVLQIFISPNAGDPMQGVQKVSAIKGLGLEGDRYARGGGTFSRIKETLVSSVRGPTPRHVSLIAHEAITESNQTLTTPFTSAETRRNIVTEGVDLNDLVKKAFAIGEVNFWGFELCDPCNRPDNLSGKSGFKKAFENRGGLRAAIVSDGIIAVGDAVTMLTVHGLFADQPLRGFRGGPPNAWPEGHRWVSLLEDHRYITCRICRDMLPSYLSRLELA